MSATPEGKLALDYAARATASGRSLSLGPVEIVEVEGRKPGKDAEAAALLAKRDGAYLIACDEHAPTRTSRDIARWLGDLRDGGARRLAFVIGGADGLGPAVLNAADARLAFGPQTWPHALVRVMLAEQIYRAITILAGGPYHRD
jgi:23S rRNA (pseudouridine1915-N3)-methyltransferase